MIENQTQEVKKQKIEQSDEDFKKAFKICQTIFYNEIYYNNKFNAIVYNSIENTVRVVVDKYGIEAILYLEYLATDKYSRYYGKQAFHPSDFIDIIESSSSEIEKFKFNLKKKNDQRTLDIKKIEEDKISSSPLFSLIPEMFDETKRAIPNVFLRSALFGVIKPGRRNFVKNQKIQSMSQYSVYYTGEQLDQNDLEAWDSVTYLAKNNGSTDFLNTSMYEICKFMGYSKDKKNREAIRSRIKRLKAGAVEINYDKKFYFGSLIDDFSFDESNGKVIIRFNKKLLSLFESGDYTLINKKIKDKLGENQLASWLFHFYETHKNSIPFKLDYLKKLSQCDSTPKEFKRMLKNSLQKIKDAYEFNGFSLQYEINDDVLRVSNYSIIPQ